MINSTTSIIFDHDGSADDFLSLIVLLTMKKYELKAITITPADCFAENALETTLKILKLFNIDNVPIGVGNCRGKNPFPSEWRAKPKILNALPDLINVNISKEDVYNNAPNLIAQTLLKEKNKTKILLTGPCTNLVLAIRLYPKVKEKIDEIVWMGGAFRVRGNVVTHNHDNSAEWNVFWDPEAASELVSLGLDITFIPLDVTNNVPVSIPFLRNLARNKDYLLARIACQFWATTLDNIPSYEYVYFMWDVLATSYLAIPEAFEVEKKIECEIIKEGASQGKTLIKSGSGNFINLTNNVDTETFYKYLSEILCENRKMTI